MNIKFKIIGSTVCISTDNGYKPINFKTYNTERLTLENIIEECDNKIKENNDKQNNIKRKRKRNIKTLDIITTILTSLALISINNYTTIFAILYSIISGIILGISTTTIFNFSTKNKYKSQIKKLEDNNINITNIKEKYKQDLELYKEKSANVPIADLYKNNQCYFVYDPQKAESAIKNYNPNVSNFFKKVEVPRKKLTKE